jgi:N-carbamoylputrescine amidase
MDTSSAPSIALGLKSRGGCGEFYGQSYFCTPRGQMLAVGKRDGDGIVIADLDLDVIRVRNTCSFPRS